MKNKIIIAILIALLLYVILIFNLVTEKLRLEITKKDIDIENSLEMIDYYKNELKSTRDYYEEITKNE